MFTIKTESKRKTPSVYGGRARPLVSRLIFNVNAERRSREVFRLKRRKTVDNTWYIHSGNKKKKKHGATATKPDRHGYLVMERYPPLARCLPTAVHEPEKNHDTRTPALVQRDSDKLNSRKMVAISNAGGT